VRVRPEFWHATRLAGQLIARLEALDRRQDDSLRELHGYAGDQAKQDRKRAVRELRVQTLGLFLVAAGWCLRVVALLLPPDAASGPCSTPGM
jgi:hypothetical protein